MTANQCPLCDKIEINSIWYEPHRVPVHEIKYVHKRCPKCSNKVKERKSTIARRLTFGLFDPI